MTRLTYALVWCASSSRNPGWRKRRDDLCTDPDVDKSMPLSRSTVPHAVRSPATPWRRKFSPPWCVRCWRWLMSPKRTRGFRPEMPPALLCLFQAIDCAAFVCAANPMMRTAISRLIFDGGALTRTAPTYGAALRYMALRTTHDRRWPMRAQIDTGRALAVTSADGRVSRGWTKPSQRWTGVHRAGSCLASRVDRTDNDAWNVRIR